MKVALYVDNTHPNSRYPSPINARESQDTVETLPNREKKTCQKGGKCEKHVLPRFSKSKDVIDAEFQCDSNEMTANFQKSAEILLFWENREFWLFLSICIHLLCLSNLEPIGIIFSCRITHRNHFSQKNSDNLQNTHLCYLALRYFDLLSRSDNMDNDCLGVCCQHIELPSCKFLVQTVYFWARYTRCPNRTPWRVIPRYHRNAMP